MFNRFIIILLSVFVFSLNAYAGTDGKLDLSKKEQPKKIKDCFEKLNRATFSFNQGLDKAIIKPIAKGYRNLPDPIQKGTKNAVTNLSNLITIPNNILQGDVKLAVINTGRLVVNTTVGLLGTIDVANDATIEVTRISLSLSGTLKQLIYPTKEYAVGPLHIVMA